MSGKTANATSARRQFIHSITPMIPTSVSASPKTVTTPDVNRSLSDVDVGRHPRHEAADRIAVVVLQVETLQVAVDGHAQIEHDPLAGQLQGPGLDVFRHERQDENGQVDAGKPVEASQAIGGDVAVDRNLDEIRLRERCDSAGHDGHQRQQHLPPVRPQVVKQPAHQPRVVGLPEDVVVVGHR